MTIEKDHAVHLLIRLVEILNSSVNSLTADVKSLTARLEILEKERPRDHRH